MIKISLIYSLVFFAPSFLWAQSTKVGLEAGMGIANTLTKSGTSYMANGPTANNNRLAMRSGVALHSNLGKKSAFQTGLYYASKGNKNIVPGGLTISYSSIELPISFAYVANKNAKINFWIGGGGYTAYIINAKVNFIDFRSNEVSEKARYGGIRYLNDLRRLEYGVQLQSGLRFKNGIFLRLLAQRQLNNLAPKKMPDINTQLPTTLRPNSNFVMLRNEVYVSLTVGYLLGLKKTKPINK